MSDDEDESDSRPIAVSGLTEEAGRVAWLRVARQILHNGAKDIGLYPASNSAELLPLALQLGSALSEVGGGQIGVVTLGRDAHTTADNASQWAGFSSRIIAPTLSVLTPAHSDKSALLVPRIADLMRESRLRFTRLIVDLSGFEARGEHLSAMALLDGVVVIAWSGVTDSDELGRASQEIPEGHNLGVVLVGGTG